ncbi:MAG: response regulator [Gemmatimonadota bacterium]
MRETPRPEPESAAPLTVLIVDDDPDMRLYVRRCLAYLGKSVGRVLEAEDGREALSLLQTNVVHLVITDVILPHLDGRSLSRAIKGDPRKRDISVLMISGEESDAAARDTADGFLAKPFNAQQLREAVDKLPLRPPRPPPSGPNGPD